MTEKATSVSSRMPVLFVGHGSPMNAIEDNQWSRGFKELAALVPKPRAVLAVSAHWFVPGTFTTGNEHPETIHDFGGFPEQLYEIKYPAPGDPDLARRVAGLLASANATVRTDWGLDHGTWSVLRYLFPDASCPVVQLSIDHRLAASGHLDIGRALAPLRNEGVLILDTDAGRSSHPSPDHYLPVLYAAGAADASDAVRFPIAGFDLGSLSMRSAIYG